MAGMQGAVMEIAKGVLGAVIASKVLPKIPVENVKARYAIGTALGAVLAVKGGRAAASIGIGMGIASGALLANEFMPNLLGPATTTATVGRTTPAMQKRMQATANMIRQGLAGPRDQTMVGTGAGQGLMESLGRDQTIVGGGYYGEDDSLM